MNLLLTPFRGLWALFLFTVLLVACGFREWLHQRRAGAHYEGHDGPGRPQDYIKTA